MSWQEIKAAIEQNGEAFNEFKQAQDQKLSKIGDRLDEVVDRVEALESKRNLPGRSGDALSRDQKEHTERFLKWIRSPNNERRRKDLVEAESEMEHKDVSTSSDAGGGFAVPEELERDIEKRVSQLNPFRNLVKVVTVGSGSYKHLVDIRGETVGWVGETDTRNATDTPSLRERAPTFGTIYAYPKATEESINDIFFDVQNWLVEDISDGFAAEEANVIISGNGTNKPTGILNTAPVSTADDASPLRDADALQFIASAASPDAILPDSLIDLAVSSIKERYLMGEGVAFVMHRNSLASVRKLKDQQDQYLWVQGLGRVSGELLGYPVFTCDGMPTVGANEHPIAFGNWRRGYLLALIGGLRITVDDNITQPGYVKYYVRRRIGGRILNNDALKVLKTT